MEPMRPPLKIEGLVVLKAQSDSGDDEEEADFNVKLGVDLPPGCVVSVDPSHGL